MVNTVGGPLSAGHLGVTYMHEHIFVLSPELQHHWPGFGDWDEDVRVREAQERLRALKEVRGCDTIVDATVPGLGRDMAAVARAVEATGLNVIGATGYYTFEKLPMALSRKSAEAKIGALVELFLSDVQHGMDGTTIKPGVLKCVTDVPGLTPDVEAVVRAVARTHRLTGLPIITHADALHERGREQQRVLAQEDVDLSEVVIGHCNQSDDLAYLEELMDAGSCIAFDRLGMPSPTATVEDQIRNLATLVRRGRARQIVLSHDDMCFVDLCPIEEVGRGKPDFPYGGIVATVMPALRELGVDDADIETMLVANPRRIFGGDDLEPEVSP